MSIRSRLTLWYAAIMFVSLLAMGALSYYQFLVVPRREAERKGGSTKEQAEEAEDFGEVTRIVLLCGVPAALLALGGGWWLMRKAMAPVVALTKAAEQIHESNLGGRLPRTGRGDEFDRLTEVFNAMTSRLDGSFQRIREFTLHASHELKTPLTVLHGELESTLQDQSLSVAERDRLFSELDEIQRLGKIVDGLTLLTKADAGQISLELELVQLDELVRDADADAQILARPFEVQLNLAACDAIALRGDRHRLRQLLLNLTDNAIKYNQSNGTVEIVLRRAEGNVAEITITNTGQGIPPERLPHVFDRFYRGDPAHSNAVEGCGLGLSIAQWIVSVHKGTIQIESVPAKHTTVKVRLPLELPASKPS